MIWPTDWITIDIYALINTNKTDKKYRSSFTGNTDKLLKPRCSPTEPEVHENKDTEEAIPRWEPITPSTNARDGLGDYLSIFHITLLPFFSFARIQSYGLQQGYWSKLVLTLTSTN